VKKLILLGISCVMLQTLSYAQDENTENILYRQIIVFTELDSGSIISDTDEAVKKANSLELGLEYKHNFAKVPWLSWFMKGTVIGKINTAFQNVSEDTSDKILNPDWIYNGISGAGLALGYIESGIRFDKYGYISFRGTTGDFLIKAYAYAPIEFGVGGTFSFFGGIEALPYLGGALRSGDTEIDPVNPSIKVLAIGMNYNVMFHENWGFNTELQYRTDGISTQSRTGGNYWEIDSPTALKNNSTFRFDNTLKFQSNGLDMWFQVRYHPKYFVRVPIPGQMRRGRTQHDVHIRAGISYAFDVSASL